MNRSVLASVVLVFGAAVASAQQMYTQVTIVLTPNHNLSSRGNAYYINSNNIVEQRLVDVLHLITNSDASYNGRNYTQYSKLIVATTPVENGDCYRAVLDVTDVQTTVNSRAYKQFCILSDGTPTAPCTPNPETGLCRDGTGGSGDGTGGVQTKYSDQCYYDLVYGSVCNSPLVVSLDGTPYRFCGADEAVAFDLDADGVVEQVTWTAGGSELAFLALDRNANGTIDSGMELFGNNTPKRDGTIAANGFDALSDLDSNQDGVIDSRDAWWSRIRLWVDRDHDGTSSTSELSTPDAVSITSFGIDHHWSGHRDRYGNVLRYQGSFNHVDGGRPYYDVYLRVVE